MRENQHTRNLTRDVALVSTIQTPLIYLTMPIQPNHVPQFWPEHGLMGHALSISLQLNGQNIIVQIEDPTYLARIDSEGYQLGMNNIMNHPWFYRAPHHPQIFPLYPNIGAYPLPWSQQPWIHQNTYSQPLPNLFNLQLPLFLDPQNPLALAPMYQHVPHHSTNHHNHLVYHEPTMMWGGGDPHRYHKMYTTP